jgi:hypothetical protein
VATKTLQNDRIEAFKFRASNTGGKMPINTLLAGITFSFPIAHFKLFV